MLDFRGAEVAQVVEQRTENPRVNSSTLFLGTISSIQSVARPRHPLAILVASVAGWQSRHHSE
jgi:hypothetical protein